MLTGDILLSPTGTEFGWFNNVNIVGWIGVVMYCVYVGVSRSSGLL